MAGERGAAGAAGVAVPAEVVSGGEACASGPADWNNVQTPTPINAATATDDAPLTTAGHLGTSQIAARSSTATGIPATMAKVALDELSSAIITAKA